MKKVRIKNLPKYKDGSVVRQFGNQTPPTDKVASPTKGFTKQTSIGDIRVNRVLKATDEENATLEAEVGETVVTDLNRDGIPEFYRISGKRHHSGGTPLNLPPNSFIFSRDNKMKIYDPDVLQMFGKTSKKDAKKGFTPAELSKSYDLNNYREILANSWSDKTMISTAEKMIENYNLKLGALALAQESLKGFPDGFPGIAMPFVEASGIDPAELVNPKNSPSVQEIEQGALWW